MQCYEEENCGEVQANKQTSKQANKQANKRTNKQASKQTSKQTSKQANKRTKEQTILKIVQNRMCKSPKNILLMDGILHRLLETELTTPSRESVAC